MKYLLIFEEFTDRENQAYDKWVDRMISEFSGNKDYLRDRLNDLKDKFFRVKSRLPNKDIFSYKSYGQLLTAVDDILKQIEETDLNKKIKMAKEGVDWIKLSEDKNWIVLVPITHIGSCKISQGTRWCTAMKQNPWKFEQYKSRGELFRFINKNLKEGNHHKKVSLFYEFDGDNRLWKSIEDYDLNEIQVDGGIILKETTMARYDQKTELISNELLDKTKEFFLSQKSKRFN